MLALRKARTRLLLNHPFFGTLVCSTPIVEDRSVPTAATDMTSIFYNPDFFGSISTDEVLGVMAHEIMHIVLKHGLRREGRNPKLWNYACDYAINPVLIDSGFKLPDGCLLDAKYCGLSAEVIYEQLQQQQNQKPKSGQPQPGEGDGDGGNPLGQDLKEPTNMDGEAKARVERSIQQRVAQAANMARMAGKVPAGLERLIDGILNPEVPWQTLLRDYMTRITHDNESWSRRNRRFNVYLPARHNQRMGEIIIIGDTSGSISAAELNKVAAEVNAISDAVQPERIRVLWADTKVQREEVFEPGETITLSPTGGGGTDMRVPLDHAEQFEPQVVVLVTDGYTPWPQVEPPYPLIVCCTTPAKVPVGQVVRI